MKSTENLEQSNKDVSKRLPSSKSEAFRPKSHFNYIKSALVTDVLSKIKFWAQVGVNGEVSKVCRYITIR